ncbi:MAG: peptidylprolyl isomerase [Gallionellaceae bacterium]|nr:peptidylprolyl isomerase [Gallionellaceae bacterium]
MTKLFKFAALTIVSAFAASVVYAEDKPAVTVNGISIPQARVDLRTKAAASQGQPDSPELQKAIRDDLVNLEILSQEAMKKGLDKQPETAQQVELAKQTVLAGAFVQDYTKTYPVSEDALKQEYETLKKRLGNKEYKVSHILVENENEAKSIAAQASKKGKFEKLAKEKSKDAGSREQGGDLGWVVPANFVKPFADALASLSKGQVSGPVQSQSGWHIIKLEDVRELKVPPYEEVKPNLTKRLQQQSVQKMIEDLRAKAKIE